MHEFTLLVLALVGIFGPIGLFIIWLGLTKPGKR